MYLMREREREKERERERIVLFSKPLAQKKIKTMWLLFSLPLRHKPWMKKTSKLHTCIYYLCFSFPLQISNINYEFVHVDTILYILLKHSINRCIPLLKASTFLMETSPFSITFIQDLAHGLKCFVGWKWHVIHLRRWSRPGNSIYMY